MYTEFFVDVDGAKLYCRRQGVGTPLLLIHGACVDSDFYLDCAQILSSQYSVISYDRRGYGRSEGLLDGDYSFATQAKDAAAIIRNIAGARCHIVAHSAGALIAMELAVSHPELIRRMFLYEPAVLDCLPKDHERYAELACVYDLIKEEKYLRAFSRFIPTLGEQDVRARASTEEELAHMQRNSMCFIHREFGHLYESKPDYEALSKVSVIVGVGELSRASHHWPIAEHLSDRLSCELIYFPGAHNCAFDLPKEFSYLTAGILKGG